MKKLGLIGCGKMGGALLRGFHAANTCSGLDYVLYDAHLPAAQALAADLPGASLVANAVAVVEQADVVLLAVKPQDLPALSQSLAQCKKQRLLISIAAGLTLDTLSSLFNSGHRIIRAMPNTPALVGHGAAAFCAGTGVSAEDRELAQRILGSVGLVVEVPESAMDTVTGLSGSGPAYIYTVIEALADGAVLMGLSRAQALQLAAQTVAGAAQMVLVTGKHPGPLRDEVTSPGGTTAAGLEQVELGNLRATLIQAVRAATERSQELAQA